MKDIYMGKQKRVMIVEDDPLLAMVTERFALSLGYDVVCNTCSGEEALKQAGEQNPQILLIDMNLAGNLDGVETAQTIIEHYMNIPVIFLSGDISKEAKDHAGEVNYLDFLSKPVSRKELADSLQKASKQDALLSQSAA